MIAEDYPLRHFVIFKQALGEGDLENANWLPGTENPAHSLTEARSDVVLLLRLLGSGVFCPGHLRPLKGVARKE